MPKSNKDRLSKKGQELASYAEEILFKIPASHLENVSSIEWTETERKYSKAGGLAGKVGHLNKGPIKIEIKHPGGKYLTKADVADLLAHEIGHRVFDYLPDSAKSSWEKAARQLSVGIDKNPFIRKNLPYLTEISSRDMKMFTGEVFADTYSLYLRDKPTLQKGLALRTQALDEIFS